MRTSHSTAIFVEDLSHDTRRYGRTKNCILERKISNVASVVLHLLKLSISKTIREFIRAKSLIGEFFLLTFFTLLEYMSLYSMVFQRVKGGGGFVQRGFRHSIRIASLQQRNTFDVRRSRRAVRHLRCHMPICKPLSQNGK